ncbi:DUF3841 domain-containing protein [Proteocatella sphenisci]|nr:DUF3841 domain-containing protein [Proteocatella sphenisci]
MDIRNNKIILYSSQAEAVLQIIERDGECFSKRKYVARPKNAEYPY